MTNRTHTKQAKNDQADRNMVVICSAVGGAGRTTVTVNLAALLAARKVKTAIIDGDLQFGDMALALDLEPRLTMKEVVERNAIDYLDDYYMFHETGLKLLAAPTRPEYAELIPLAALESIIDSARTETDVLIVETAHGLNEQNLALMEKADTILVVTTPGMAALKNTKLMVETLDMLGMGGRISLVVNKATAPSVIKVSDIPELTQVKQAYFLPEDTKHVAHSLDTGIPLVMSNPKLAFSKEVEKLVEALFPSWPSAAKKPAGGGILGKVGKKAKALKIRGEQNEFISPTTIEEPRTSQSS